MSARLTTAQRARVRELVEDEGETREAAEAWVRNFEPSGSVPWAEETRDCLASRASRSARMLGERVAAFGGGALVMDPVPTTKGGSK